MGICWYCHWGWAEPVAKIYLEAVERLGGNEMPLHFGPAHIVWEDENFEDDNLQYCIDNFDKYADSHSLSAEERVVARWSLDQMLALPADLRCIEPEDYDGVDPEKYPPKCKVVKV